ncbi:hypothetical protein BH09MYX1_BH09MYX1_38840 [soil metagenome]
MRAFWSLLASLVVLFAVATARADDAPAKELTQVTTGLYVNQIHELNLKENYFVADVFVWFRWRGDAKPAESFSFIDGRVESKNEVETSKLPDGTNYACFRVVVRITKFWDVRQYPLDSHHLTITVEEDRDEDDTMVYVADTDNSALDPHVKMPGFVTTLSEVKAGIGEYHSNFGDTSIPSGNTARYARVSLSISLAREGNTYFAKLFFALWISAAIAFLCFFIKPTNVDPRFGLGVGAAFAAIASEYTVTSGLPEIGVATLADKLHVVAYAAIFVVLAQSTVSLWFVEHDREKTSKRLDRAFAIGLPIAYAITNLFVIMRR